MRELLKNIVKLEKAIEELRDESTKVYKAFYSGYLKGIRDIKWILLKGDKVIK